MEIAFTFELARRANTKDEKQLIEESKGFLTFAEKVQDESQSLPERKALQQ